MLFQSSIRKELARSFGATLVVLVTIVMTIVLIRTLGQASRGAVDPQDIVLFMGYSALGRMPTILTLSLFIAMVSTLSRMYQDSEMVVWLTSGQGLAGFLRPLFQFAWPVLLVISLMALFVWPWTNQQTKDMQNRYQQRGDLARVAPGQFQESSNGNRVFFIERNATENATKNTTENVNSHKNNHENKKTSSELNNELVSHNVFISSTENNKHVIITAQSGRVEQKEGTQFLILSNGQRIENEMIANAKIGEKSNEKSNLKISDFEEYGVKINEPGLLKNSLPEAKLLSIRSLIKVPSRANLSELAWRIGLALAAINFVILALALASVNPRGGRSGNMLFVVLTFVVYNNLVNLGQNWIFVGLIGFGSFLLLLHGGILLLGLAWLAKRHHHWVIRFRQRPQASSTTPAIHAIRAQPQENTL